MNKILLADDTIDRDELYSLSEWIKTGNRLTKGPLCLEFEEKFAKWQGSKYSIFVNSGSSANLLIAQALLESQKLRNKTIIVPAVSWVTTATPFMQLGYDVKLCDCNLDDVGLDIGHFERLCREHNPSCVILVHVLGHANKMNQVFEICQKYDVLVIEDSCEGLGSTYKDKKLGSHGMVGSFSFYYGHHISTIEGGMVITDDQDFYNIMLSIRSHGWGRDVPREVHNNWKDKYEIDEVRDLYTFYYSGFNLRSTDLNAFIGLSQINKLDDICLTRQKNFSFYSELLSDFWCQKSETVFISSFAYAVLVENRLEVYKYLKEKNIESRPLICGNLGLHPFWIKEYGECHLDNADIIHDFGLYLPNHYNLTKEQISYICKIFKEVAKPLKILNKE